MKTDSGDWTALAQPASLSPTALRAYDECPRRFAYAYIEKPDVDDPPSAELVFGNALHEALAHLFRLEPSERSEEIAHRALRHHWLRQRGRSEAFLTEDEEAQWGIAALQALSIFCQNRAAELELKPLAVEEWVRAPLDHGHSIAGKVDRTERIRVPDLTAPADQRIELEGLRVTDYKSGRCRFADGDELAEDRGAQVYALAATRTFRLPVLEVRFLYLREDKAVSWRPEREDLAALEERLAKDIDAICADEDFEARPDFHCRWCRYRELCPARHGASLQELEADPETVF